LEVGRFSPEMTRWESNYL